MLVQREKLTDDIFIRMGQIRTHLTKGTFLNFNKILIKNTFLRPKMAKKRLNFDMPHDPSNLTLLPAHHFFGILCSNTFINY